jgi:hypothetical protein
MFRESIIDEPPVSAHLVRLFSGDGRRLVAVIEAYLDEASKTLIGRPVEAVSGFIGTRDQWKHFEDIWSTVLEATGIPYYHGKDPKCHKLRKPMVSAIRASGIRGFTATAFRDEYRQAGPEMKSLLGNHYSFLALGLSVNIRKWAQANNAGPVAFVLEDGQPNVEHVMRLIRSLGGGEVASVACANKQAFVGLQAADFLAHHSAALDKGLAWIHQLLGDGPGQVMWGHLDPNGISGTSVGMAALMRKHRHNKTQKKRAKRDARRR